MGFIKEFVLAGGFQMATAAVGIGVGVAIIILAYFLGDAVNRKSK